MSRPATNDDANKFARYRAMQRSRGLKLLRIWVTDQTAPGFAEEAIRQARIINAAPDARDTDAFLEGALAQLDQLTNDADTTRLDDV